MSNKIFSIVLGFLLIFGGVFYFFRDIITVSYGAICAVAFGLAFTVFYFKRKRAWSLLLGIYLLYFGIAFGFFAGLPIYGYLVTSIFFFAPGTIFMILYYSSDKKSALLTFGLLLLEIGVAVLLTGMYDFNNVNILLLCIGMAFVLDYILLMEYDNKATLIIGVILMLLSVRKFLSINGYTDIIISTLLVIAGFVVIIKALLNKEEKH